MTCADSNNFKKMNTYDKTRAYEIVRSTVDSMLAIALNDAESNMYDNRTVEHYRLLSKIETLQTVINRMQEVDTYIVEDNKEIEDYIKKSDPYYHQQFEGYEASVSRPEPQPKVESIPQRIKDNDNHLSTMNDEGFLTGVTEPKIHFNGPAAQEAEIPNYIEEPDIGYYRTAHKKYNESRGE